MTRMQRSQSGCDMLMQAFVSQPALRARQRVSSTVFYVQYDSKRKIVR